MAQQITDSNYAEIIASGLPVVIDFWAEWCGPCKKIAPMIDELAQEFEGKVIIGKCDVEENDNLTTEFKIRNIPTLLFFKNGEKVDSMVAPNNKAQIIAKINSLL